MVSLSKERIAELAPSVFATGHDGLRSSRYTFVSSEDVIDTMAELGWGVSDAQQPNNRVSSEIHSKHLIRFRPEGDDLTFTDPRTGGLVFPEVINYNSSNGTCRWRLVSGAFSMVCSNGLVIRIQGFEDVGETISRKHMGFDPQFCLDAVGNMVEGFGGFFQTVSDMTQVDLSDDQRADFAIAARDLRFPEKSTMDPMALLQPRRETDTGRDIWTTYNVLQENCVRGGLKVTKRTSRDLTNIDALDRVNSGLWSEAEKILAVA